MTTHPFPIAARPARSWPAQLVTQARWPAPESTATPVSMATPVSTATTAPLDRHGHDRSSPLAVARDVTRIWGRGAGAQVGVQGIDLEIGEGELLALVGPSGSGKSTLGSLLVGIDTPTSGSLLVAGQRIDRLGADALATWRAHNVGIVFQQFHLLPTLSAQENVELALELAGVRRGRARAAADALAAVGLAAKARRLPAQLSGGEQQRVAVARAIVRRPRLVLADEPTGSLDQDSGAAVFALLAGLVAAGTTVVLITHDLALAAAAHRTVRLLDGRIVGADPATPARSATLPTAAPVDRTAR